MSSSGDSRHPTLESLESAESTAARPRAALDDSERELAVLSAVLKSFTAWECFQGGSERLLGELGAALGQMAAVLWLPEGDLLQTRASWCMPSVDREAFERAFRALRVPRGIGLAGWAWERRLAVDRPCHGPREYESRCEKLPHGLVATVAIPCWSADEVLAVVELYSSARAELSSNLMQVLALAGHDLGVFFARRRGQLRPCPLSPREMEILALSCEGNSVLQTAERLAISPATVKTHLEHSYKKLGVRDRTAAVARALRAGFIE